MRTTSFLYTWFTCLCIVLCVQNGAATVSDNEEGVVELTSATFEHQTQASTGQTTGKWFVMYYAPWCGHCKSLSPIWDSLKQELAALDSNNEDGIVVAKVDCTTSKDICERFGVRGYPTLKYIANGKVYDYAGPRTLEGFVQFVTQDWKSQTGDDVPSPPSWWETFIQEHEFLNMLQKDFDHILSYRKNAAAILVAIGVLIGLLLGSLLVFSFRPSEKKTKMD